MAARGVRSHTQHTLFHTWRIKQFQNGIIFKFEIKDDVILVLRWYNNNISRPLQQDCAVRK